MWQSHSQRASEKRATVMLSPSVLRRQKARPNNKVRKAANWSSVYQWSWRGITRNGIFGTKRSRLHVAQSLRSGCSPTRVWICRCTDNQALVINIGRDPGGEGFEFRNSVYIGTNTPIWPILNTGVVTWPAATWDTNRQDFLVPKALAAKNHLTTEYIAPTLGHDNTTTEWLNK
jgi:hypothetical protein